MQGEDIFCKLYPVWEKNGEVIYENKVAYAIFSVTPAMPAQAMVIPKKHVIRFSELEPEESKLFFEAIEETFAKIQEYYDRNEVDKIKKFYERLVENPPLSESKNNAEEMLKDDSLNERPMAYNVGINCGKEAGQLIDHIHLHIFPIRKEGKGVITAMRSHYQNNRL